MWQVSAKIGGLVCHCFTIFLHGNTTVYATCWDKPILFGLMRDFTTLPGKWASFDAGHFRKNWTIGNWKTYNHLETYFGQQFINRKTQLKYIFMKLEKIIIYKLYIENTRLCRVYSSKKKRYLPRAGLESASPCFLVMSVNYYTIWSHQSGDVALDSWTVETVGVRILLAQYFYI